MQTTGIFQTQKYKIPKVELNKTISLIPFGDIHYGAPNHAGAIFDSWLEKVKTEKDAVFLGMGDYFDIASASERRLLHSADLHESTTDTLDELYKRQAEEFGNKICFMKGRIAGMIEGNHYSELKSGITTTQYLCEILGCKYLGVAGFVRIQLCLGTMQISVDIFAHHGKGASRLIGGSLNRVQQLAEVAHADIYLMGHDHKRSAGVQSRMYLDKLSTVKEQRQLFARTGSFLTAYRDGKVSYIADMALPASDLGAITIHMTPHRDRAKEGRGLWVQLEASI